MGRLIRFVMTLLEVMLIAGMGIVFLFSPFFAGADPDVDYDECMNHVRLAQMDMESYARRFGNMIHYGAKDPADYAAMQREYAEINKQVEIAQRCATIHNIKFNKNKYFHHQQPHTGVRAGAGASVGSIRTYEQVVKLVEKYPIDSSRIRKGGVRLETRLVPSEQELLNIERQLTHGLSATNRPAPGKGVVQLYHLQDGTKVGIRDFSASGGRTIDITPLVGKASNKSEIRLHIK